MKLHLTSLAISLLLPIAAAAAPRERAPVGSVHQIADHQLQVCFKHTPAPDVGTSLAIQRGFVPYKSSGATLYKTIGHARVTVTEDSEVPGPTGPTEPTKPGTEKPTTKPNDGKLSATGADTAVLATIAALFALAGGAVVAVRRRSVR